MFPACNHQGWAKTLTACLLCVDIPPQVHRDQRVSKGITYLNQTYENWLERDWSKLDMARGGSCLIGMLTDGSVNGYEKEFRRRVKELKEGTIIEREQQVRDWMTRHGFFRASYEMWYELTEVWAAVIKAMKGTK